MEELLKNKLKAAAKLKKLTAEINELSLKTDYDKVNSLIDKRQQLIDEIDAINEGVIEKGSNNSSICSEDIKKLNKEIQKVFKEIYETDNIIRKNINIELKLTKEKLNRPQSSTSVNIKL